METEQYEIYESRLNNHSLEEIEAIESNFYIPIINKLLLLHKNENKDLTGTLKNLADKICRFDLKIPINGSKRQIKPRYDKSRKTWIAETMISGRHVHIKTSVNKHIVKREIERFCDKNGIKNEAA